MVKRLCVFLLALMMILSMYVVVLGDPGIPIPPPEVYSICIICGTCNCPTQPEAGHSLNASENDQGENQGNNRRRNLRGANNRPQENGHHVPATN